jgi:hypothetical protein
LLLGAAGLLPSQRDAAPHDPQEARWEEHWRALERRGRRPPEPPAAQAPSSRRPANHPARRLAGLAQLLGRPGPRLEEVALQSQPPEGRASNVIEAWTVPARGYWRQHSFPGVGAGRTPGALIGRDRAVELLVNAVLPWAAAKAEAAGEPDHAALARTAFARLPRPGRYGALAVLEANLRVGGEPLPLDARRQQGLLTLHKAECTQGGCGRCPFS